MGPLGPDLVDITKLSDRERRYLDVRSDIVVTMPFGVDPLFVSEQKQHKRKPSGERAIVLTGDVGQGTVAVLIVLAVLAVCLVYLVSSSVRPSVEALSLLAK